MLGICQWLNTQGMRPEDLRGKVVLVNFWTYSCINSLRPLAYLKHGPINMIAAGLFSLASMLLNSVSKTNSANVRHATATLGHEYPIVLDDAFAAWRTFENQVRSVF